MKRILVYVLIMWRDLFVLTKALEFHCMMRTMVHATKMQGEMTEYVIVCLL